jgi:hypothetical protein
MQDWQKHALGFVFPLAISAAVLALAPENAPEWMIVVGATGIIIAITYSFLGFGQWMQRHQNHTRVSAALIALTFLGPILAIAFKAPAALLTLGLGPVAVGVFLMGYFGRMQGNLKRIGNGEQSWAKRPAWVAIPLALAMLAALAYSFTNGSFELLNQVLAPLALAIGLVVMAVRRLLQRLR